MHKRAETSPKTVVLHRFHEKHVRNTKGFTLISGRVMRNPMRLHVCASFSKNFNFFILGFFPEPRYDGRGYRNRAHVTHSQRTRKRARYCLRIMDFSGIIQILSSTSSYGGPQLNAGPTFYRDLIKKKRFYDDIDPYIFF